jgi:hypothetical protein
MVEMPGYGSEMMLFALSRSPLLAVAVDSRRTSPESELV